MFAALLTFIYGYPLECNMTSITFLTLSCLLKAFFFERLLFKCLRILSAKKLVPITGFNHSFQEQVGGGQVDLEVQRTDITELPSQIT